MDISCSMSTVMVHLLQQPEIWQTWQHGGLDTSPGDALAAWVVKVSSAWLLLANEYNDAMTFGQAPPPEDVTSIIHGGGSSTGGSGEPGAGSEVTEQRTLEAGGRQWVKTPLQVRPLGPCHALSPHIPSSRH